MLLLAVDFGNTTLKAALFENEELLEVRYSLSTADLENWTTQIEAKNKISSKKLEGIIISSVRKNEENERKRRGKERIRKRNGKRRTRSYENIQ